MPDPINLSLSLPYYSAALVFGYLLGAIPFGLLLTKFAGLGDIRQVGSGNIGATNVLRTGNKSIALLTLLLDGGKGILAAIIGKSFGPDIAVIAGFGAFIGHLFPVWLRFKGGKGVATYFGIAIGLYWPVALMAIGTWLFVAVVTRYSSLSALTAALLTPGYFWMLGWYQLSQLFIVVGLLVFFRHWENIKRLMEGSETKIGG